MCNDMAEVSTLSCVYARTIISMLNNPSLKKNACVHAKYTQPVYGLAAWFGEALHDVRSSRLLLTILDAPRAIRANS